MPCTTILVGKKASYDGSTMTARNDDGSYDVKKLIVVNPKDQPKKYKSVIAHLEIELPDNPMRYTACPNVKPEHGVWPACGINEANVGMTATETITSNPLVIGADPYVTYKKAEKRGQKDIPGGIGEEDLVTLVLPYIHTAKEGVLRLAELTEKYGTYEPNGIAFNDENEIWWYESIGGHHWIARRVKDEEYVIMPNQFGLDRFDFDDAFGAKKENMCSADLKEFIKDNHLDCNNDGKFNPRNVFGSHADSDHVYNTPRAWFMGRYFNPTTYKWDGEDADFGPESDNIPWALVPERKITPEDVKYILSSYYQGTPYNPYAKADIPEKGKYRSIGINRTGCMAILQIRDYVPDACKAVEWICFGSNAFNTVVPVYTNVTKMPKYLSEVSKDATTDSFYWQSRFIGALADPWFGYVVQIIERYQKNVPSKAHAILNEYDKKIKTGKDMAVADEANEKLAAMAKTETQSTLNQILHAATTHMKNGYNRADN